VLASIPVIALTAHAMADDEARARACGCDDFLTKPVDEDALFEKLAKHLGR
jgi:CheY-like chemotaxis protein